MPLPGVSFEATRQRTFLPQNEDHSGNDPHWFQFSTFEFRDIFGTDPECTRTSGLRENLSKIDRGPKTRLSVQLTSWDIFIVTLPSISSDTWLINSSWFPWTILFREWLLIKLSSWSSVLMAANICFSVWPFSGENIQAVFDTELTYYLLTSTEE